jgi:hypothetical protein
MRVLAIRDANKTEINIYGYGKYEGDEPCPMMGGIRNPKIVLDNGDVVWGCECWWGDVEKAEQELQLRTGKRRINIVTVERETDEK